MYLYMDNEHTHICTYLYNARSKTIAQLQTVPCSDMFRHTNCLDTNSICLFKNILYIHVDIYMYIYTCTCIYVHVYLYIYTCTCISVHVYMYIYTCTYIHVHVYLYMYICTCISIHVYMYMYRCTCTYIHVYIHTQHLYSYKQCPV